MSNVVEITAEEINEAIESGSEVYWRKIYNRYFIPLKLYFMREFGPLPSDIAEDLSFHTLLKLINGKVRPRFSHSRQLSVWLYKAARCTAIDYWKSVRGKMHKATHTHEYADDLWVNAPSAFEAGPREKLVYAALQHLSQTERSLLSMRANATPYRTIAEELKLKENVARTYFNRAKKRFAAHYLKLQEEQNENQSQGIHRTGALRTQKF